MALQNLTEIGDPAHVFDAPKIWIVPNEIMRRHLARFVAPTELLIELEGQTG